MLIFFIESQTLLGWRSCRRFLIKPPAQSGTFLVQLFPSLYCSNTIPMFPTCVSVSLCTKGICENLLKHKNYVRHANVFMFCQQIPQKISKAAEELWNNVISGILNSINHSQKSFAFIFQSQNYRNHIPQSGVILAAAPATLTCFLTV